MTLKVLDKNKKLLVSAVNFASYIFYIFHSTLSFRFLAKKRRIKKVLVYNVGLIGDTIISLPALTALKSKYSDVTVVTSQSDLLRDFKTIKFIPSWIQDEKNQYFNLKDFKNIIKFSKQIKKQNFDLAIDMRGDIRNLFLLYLTAIPRRVGYASTGGSHFLTSVVPHKNIHEVEKKLDIARYLNCTVKNPYPKFDVPKQNIKNISTLMSRLRLTKKDKIVCILPSAGYQTKLWYDERWAGLISEILKRKNTKVLLLGGPKDQQFNSIIDLIPAKKQVVNLIGKLKLLDTAALLKKADLFISPDNGIMHMAAALGTPTISLFGPVNPKRWGPYVKYKSKHKVIYKEWYCSPCGLYNSCPIDKKCMSAIRVNDVLRLIK